MSVGFRRSKSDIRGKKKWHMIPLFILIVGFVQYFVMRYKNKIIPALIMVIVLNICLDKSYDTSGWNLFNYIKAAKYVLHLSTSR